MMKRKVILAVFYTFILHILDQVSKANGACDCALNTARLYTGLSEVDPNKHSWMVQIIVKSFGKDPIKCSGVIINSNQVMAPWNCIKQGRVKIIAHIGDRSHRKSKEIFNVYEARDVNKEYSPGVGILTIPMGLRGKIFSSVKPICIARISELASATKIFFVWSEEGDLYRFIPEGESLSEEPSSSSKANVRYTADGSHVVTEGYDQWVRKSVFVYLKNGRWFLEGIANYYSTTNRAEYFSRVDGIYYDKACETQDLEN